jgi:hypothetical protein
VTPAELLNRLDQAATAADQRAAELRESAGRLRGELARASSLLAEVAPPEPVEPPRKRGRPSRTTTTAARPNGAAKPPQEPAKRRRRTVYPRGLSEREKYLFKMRAEGRADLADAIERGARTLLSGLIELGWKTPRRRQPEPTVAEPVEVVEVVASEPGAGDQALRPKTAPEDSKVVEAAEPEPAPAPPEPAKRRAPTTTGSPSDIQRDHDGPVTVPNPRSPELAKALDAVIENESRAAAALAEHRRRRIENEPPVKWTPGAHADL